MQGLGFRILCCLGVCRFCRAVPLEFVALKFQKSARHYTEAAADEVQLLTKVKDGMRHPCWREAAKSFSVRRLPRVFSVA